MFEMNKMSVKTLAIDAMLLCILIIGSKITIPLGIINLTMQLPVVFLILFITDKKNSVFIIGTYILIGLFGLPVFSNGGGYVYLFKPSFGYILGFLVAAILLPKKLNNGLFVLINIALGLLIVYVFGSVYMYLILNYYMHVHKGIGYVITVAVLPFILKDIICAYIASAIAYRLRGVVIENNYTKAEAVPNKN